MLVFLNLLFKLADHVSSKIWSLMNKDLTNNCLNLLSFSVSLLGQEVCYLHWGYYYVLEMNGEVVYLWWS